MKIQVKISFFFIFWHSILSYIQNFKSLADREISLKSITKLHPKDMQKQVHKSVVKRKIYFYKPSVTCAIP